MTTQPLFGLVPAGQPLITAPTAQPSATSFLYLIPTTATGGGGPRRPFAHLAVFLLPDVAAFPPDAAAAIYVARNPSALAPGGPGAAAADFRFLGGVGPGKESAVFKIGGGGGGGGSGTKEEEEGVVIGINIEDAAGVAERIQQLQQQSQSATSTALVPATATTATTTTVVSTQVLAQRIIQNAFNFLSSFSGQVGGAAGAVEVVPLKAFQDWWRKFETRIRNDPSFLERQQD
ncbi:putative DUF775 domain-containing protein [Rosellinia necatrix]|uniref:Putative DUF775 domain-containing protein n=1 Tax=Rosellinia necatrix TaxID=77044 RepID=A0A1W2TTV2_ROSNE|nr:putative DUF775 domain-containing protein [Rosellinia necatrix]